MRTLLIDMKQILALIAVALLAASAHASDLITATITVTNAIGTTNGQTLTVNGNTRTWTNAVSSPATQILTNNTANKAATNLFNHIALAPFTGLTLTRASTNQIILRGLPGGVLDVTLSADWGIVSFATNTLTAATVVRVPYTVEAAAVRTNVANGTVQILNGSEATTYIYENSPSVAHLVGITNAQTITGAKRFNGVATLISPGVFAPLITNGVNYGNAFSSHGAGIASEQFGVGATASADGSTALGNGAIADGQNGTAAGTESQASGLNSAAVGSGATATGISSVALGGVAQADGSSALGQNSFVASTHTNSTAIGQSATTTAKNQVMLGTSAIDVAVNHNLTVGGVITGVSFGNTNGFPSGSDVAFGRYDLSSLANGNNAGVIVGTNVFVEVSGPSGAFVINGIAGGRDGKFIIILNQTTQNMTIAHDSGTDPVAANRIYTMTAADRATTGNGAAMLIYSGAASRWILISLDQ